MSLVDQAIDLQRTLRERFALERFRPGQREVIEHILDRRDVLCVMPTGGGKSLCYQLPALLLPGLTLVVSPLIALMKDQVDSLAARGIRATLINSTLDPSEQHLRLLEIEGGKYDLVYVAPERFRSGRFVAAMARIKPALLAVDEAHCISEWGHDFRPDYARLGQARRALGMPTCIALTATATDLVRRDIAEQLDLREPKQFVTGFDRPNLVYRVVAARKDQEKLAAVAEVLGLAPGPAIIYASSRKRCDEIGRFLEAELRKRAVVYHAGLTREERTLAQERFMEGDAEVVVATNAFGMGVDKADVRSVIHFNTPGTLEAYYQEAGRAGRDSLPAQCVLLYAPGDRFLQELFIENEYPPPDAVYRVYEFLRGLEADPIELTQAEIREAARLDLNESAVGTALKILEGAAALERFRPRENMAIVRINAEPDEPSLLERLGPQAHVQRTVLLGLEGLVNRRCGEPVYFHPDDFAAALGLDRAALIRAIKNLVTDLPMDYVPPFRGNAVRIIDRSRRARDLTIDFAALHRRKQQEYDKLERMFKYAQETCCRRAYLLGYFGDTETTHCGRCDNCGGDLVPAAPVSARPIDTPEGREVIQKVLSGVARAKGRFGKTVVAQMLTGSGSEKIVRFGLTRLSTFNILRGTGLTQAEVLQILDSLTKAGLIESSDIDRFKPVVNLTSFGWAWLRGQDASDVALDLPDYLMAKIGTGGLTRRLYPEGNPHTTSFRESPTPAVAVATTEATWVNEAEAEPAGPETEASSALLEDDPLWQRLRALRLCWAQEANQKAFQIFPNTVLEALVRQRPRTPHDLAAIKGIGPSKLERFGAALLEAIRESPPPTSAAPPAPDQPKPAAPPGPSAPVPEPSRPSAATPPPQAPRSAAATGSYVPTEEWTWRLLDRGFTLEEAAAIRGLELAAIIRHASWVARQGRPVPLEAFLTPAVIAHWDDWRRARGDVPPPAENGETSGLWQLYLACRDAS